MNQVIEKLFVTIITLKIFNFTKSRIERFYCFFNFISLRLEDEKRVEMEMLEEIRRLERERKEAEARI
ncbi:hypothetical protein BpHYR1_035765 [Brachionus plicatilis]|uniref:Uncharacterized protein n=1 Tax=Brachionus plicatilis TaxID=10195 RepID=A0A3M7Q9L0_BRAPC|nr:hypothetical protein BpHYR1_035765 [Brachionus plicatilis]